MAAPIPHHYCFDYPTEETSNIFNSINGVPLLNYDINSPVSVASFPDPFGVNSDCMLVPQLPETEMAFRVSDYSHNQEECRRFMVPSFWPAYNCNPMPSQNWAIPEEMTKVEETKQVKVERYSVEERKDRILRYLKKRNQRNFNKTIKYACRKTLADKRVRVRGRFAKNRERCSQDEILINTSNDACYQINNSFHDDSFQMMKYDDDYWSEAAIMDNLGQLPYLAI